MTFPWYFQAFSQISRYTFLSFKCGLYTFWFSYLLHRWGQYSKDCEKRNVKLPSKIFLLTESFTSQGSFYKGNLELVAKRSLSFQSYFSFQGISFSVFTVIWFSSLERNLSIPLNWLRSSDWNIPHSIQPHLKSWRVY